MPPFLAVLTLAACAPPTLTAALEADPGGLVVHASRPVDRVVLVDAAGQPVVERVVERPAREVRLRASLTPGAYRVRLAAGEETLEAAVDVADPGPATVRIQAPLGQEDVPSGTRVPLPGGRPVGVGLVVEAHRDVTVVAGDETRTLRASERAVFVRELGVDGLDETLEVAGEPVRVRLEGERVALDVLRERLEVSAPVVPARADGAADPTLPAGRVDLPAAWWEAVLDRLRLGFRARDDQAPRTSVGVTLANRSADPLVVVVDARVEVDGVPHPAFAPRTRDATDLSTVRRLVRVPPEDAVQVGLPVYLDRAAVPDALLAEVVLEVRALGAPAVLHRRTAPLAVGRGSPWASALFGLGVLSAVGGWILVAVRFRSWVAGPTRQLTTIAVFGTLSFVLGAVSQVVGLGLGTVLGPFAPFVLGLVDDVVRMALLAALLTLVPRAGTLSLALLLGWLMRAVVLGAAHPVDAVYLGASVLWLEAGVWATGLSRGRLDVLRLIVGLALPNAVLTALALAVSAVVYRLFYADLYLVALVVGPGLLYPAVGCVLAVPFARSLREVAG
jgi:hypothetical protein